MVGSKTTGSLSLTERGLDDGRSLLHRLSATTVRIGGERRKIVCVEYDGWVDYETRMVRMVKSKTDS